MLPGGIHVLKGYKIHEEQIAKIARDLKEHCHTRRPDSRLHGCSSKRNEQQKNGKTGSAPRVQVKKTVWETGPVENSVVGGHRDLFPTMETPLRTAKAIRCFRCGVDFPVADFFYAQKSGLCIDCWEEMVL
jgi:hypothetical protein